MSILKAESLAKVYKKRRVVEDVSLTVNSGEIVGLLGPNGAGKTTTFYMVVGIVTLNAGKIYLDDHAQYHVMDFVNHIKRRQTLLHF